ncbi:MAG TPA: vanadium-dependent haloperoxidase [Puia sp.]
MKRWITIALLAMGLNHGVSAQDAGTLHRSIKEVTDVMVHDIFSPPVASRIYAYISVAAYEAARPGNPRYRSFAGQLHGLQSIAVPQAGKQYNFSLAAIEAVLLTGKAMVISEGAIGEFRAVLLDSIRRSGMAPDVYQNSLEYGKTVALEVLAWAGKDHYKETRSYPKYDVDDAISSWKPTPPVYMRAIEPHWSEMRTFFIDSARQFVPHPPTPFSIEKGSAFYRDAMEVYEAGRTLSEEQKEIANFWDCNPYKVNQNGHVIYASKKISPGGHWMNITAVACRRANADLVRSAEAYARVALVIADAFISCWDEKYRSKAIRPETYVNQYISPEWMPLLQTPPFPEYTSGHSIVSASAATVLKGLFGEPFAFTDSTEMEFGIPPRSFAGFRAAADEAAISRFYGGIHFKPAIYYGLEEGYKIGDLGIERMQTRSEAAVAR